MVTGPILQRKMIWRESVLLTATGSVARFWILALCWAFCISLGCLSDINFCYTLKVTLGDNFLFTLTF